LAVYVSNADTIGVNDGKSADTATYQTLGAPATDATDAEDDHAGIRKIFHSVIADEELGTAE
jgi:hypothetical protein